MSDELKEDLKTIGTAGTHARTAEQHTYMQKALKNGECRFCPPYKFKEAPIHTSKYWITKKNDSPYEHHDHHYVLIYSDHTNNVLEVGKIAWAELQSHFNSTVLNNGILGGGLIMRFGLSSHNASTMRHLHGHIQGPALSVILENQERLLQNVETQDNEHFFMPIGWSASNINRVGQWFIKKKQILRPGYLAHYLIYHQDPDANVLDLNPHEWVNLFSAFQGLVEDEHIPGGGLCIPAGLSVFNNRLTRRPYMEIHVPDGEMRNVRAVLVPDVYRCGATFSKDPSRQKEREKRLKEWTKPEPK